MTPDKEYHGEAKNNYCRCGDDWPCPEEKAIRQVLSELKGREEQVDSLQQWLDEVDVELGTHIVFQEERLARIEELKKKEPTEEHLTVLMHLHEQIAIVSKKILSNEEAFGLPENESACEMAARLLDKSVKFQNALEVIAHSNMSVPYYWQEYAQNALIGKDTDVPEVKEKGAKLKS